jgi:hypothetical protein
MKDNILNEIELKLSNNNNEDMGINEKRLYG